MLSSITKMVEAEIQEAKEESVAKKMKLGQSNDDDGLSEKIKQQLDYYFSDVNIIKDKFLLGEIQKDDGWVKLSVLLTFSRLQQLTKDENRIVEALQKCQSDVIELDDSKRQIRRKNKLPDAEEYKKELDSRTLHISGFPTDYTFDFLRTFCSQFGEVESVAMRRHFKTRFFKGCIHVVYKRVEDAKKVLEVRPLKCKDRELQLESMEQYHKRKAEMREKRMENRKKRKDGGGDRQNKRKHSDDEDDSEHINEQDDAGEVKASEVKASEEEAKEKSDDEVSSKKEGADDNNDDPKEE